MSPPGCSGRLRGDPSPPGLYEKTGDLHLVQRALGYITTTEIYARVDDDAVRRAVRLI